MPKRRWIEKSYARPCPCDSRVFEREEKPRGWVDRCITCGAVRVVHYGCYATADDGLPYDVARWNIELMVEVARFDGVVSDA
jgi:hypothetical protein